MRVFIAVALQCMCFAFSTAHGTPILQMSMPERVQLFRETERIYRKHQFTLSEGGTQKVYLVPSVDAASPIGWVPSNPREIDVKTLGFSPLPNAEGRVPLSIEFTFDDAVTAALRLHEDGYGAIDIVNYANAFMPGGAASRLSFDPQGAHIANAQEEGLTLLIAGLIESLIAHAEPGVYEGVPGYVYKEGSGLTDDSPTGVYLTSQASIIRNYEGTLIPPVPVNVITSAAYNMGYVGNPYSGAGTPLIKPPSLADRNKSEYQPYMDGMRRRIRTQLYAAAVEYVKTKIKPVLITGLIGTGVFGNNPDLIAQIYADELDLFPFKGLFRKVIFSLFGRERPEFIQPFLDKAPTTKNVIFEFPQLTGQGIFTYPLRDPSGLLSSGSSAGSSSSQTLFVVEGDESIRHRFAEQPGIQVNDGSRIRPGDVLVFSNQKRIVVEKQGNTLYLAGPIDDVPTGTFSIEPEEDVNKQSRLISVPWTGQGWYNGFSGSKPFFFVLNTPRVHTFFSQPDISIRLPNNKGGKITHVTTEGPFLYVHYEGQPLTAEEAKQVHNLVIVDARGAQIS